MNILFLFFITSSWVKTKNFYFPINIVINHLIFRRQFRKSTTCDISSEDILPNENKLSSMNRKRQNRSRRFSLVKIELPADDSNVTKGLKRILFFKITIFIFVKMNKNQQFHLLLVLILFKNYFFDNLAQKHDLIQRLIL
jgi:hypothetical protein